MGLSDQIVPDAAQDEKVLKVIRIAMVQALGGVNPRDARVAIELNWSRHLANVFPGLDSHFEIIPDAVAAEKKIRAKQLHGLSMGIVHYLQLKERTALRPVFISSRRTEPLESYLLLVRKGANWLSLSRSPQKRLVTEKAAGPTIGRMWLDTVLWDKQLVSGHAFFTEALQADKPARVILPVFFGQAEACLVPESAYQAMVELNPQISQRLTVLERSPGLIKTIHCVTELMPDEMVNRFLQKGMPMEDTIDGRQLLLIFHVKKNFVFKPAYLAGSERIFQKYHQIIGKN